MGRKLSVWTVEGRLERTKQRVTPEKLDRLKKKRDGQLRRLIEDNKKASQKKIHRWKDKLNH